MFFSGAGVFLLFAFFFFLVPSNDRILLSPLLTPARGIFCFEFPISGFRVRPGSNGLSVVGVTEVRFKVLLFLPPLYSTSMFSDLEKTSFFEGVF